VGSPAKARRGGGGGGIRTTTEASVSKKTFIRVKGKNPVHGPEGLPGWSKLGDKKKPNYRETSWVVHSNRWGKTFPGPKEGEILRGPTIPQQKNTNQGLKGCWDPLIKKTIQQNEPNACVGFFGSQWSKKTLACSYGCLPTEKNQEL